MKLRHLSKPQRRQIFLYGRSSELEGTLNGF